MAGARLPTQEACLSLLLPRTRREPCESEGSTASQSAIQRSGIPATKSDLRVSAAVLECHTDADTPFIGLHFSPSIETSLVAGSSTSGALQGVWHVRALPPASCGAKAILPRPTPGSHAKLKCAGSLCKRCRRTEFAKCHHEHAFCEPGLKPVMVPRSLNPERVETALGGDTEGFEFRPRFFMLCS